MVDVIVPLPISTQGIVFPATGAADAVPVKRVRPMMAMRLRMQHTRFIATRFPANCPNKLARFGRTPLAVCPSRDTNVDHRRHEELR